MSIGGILGEAWALYTRFFSHFVVIALAVYGVVNLLNAVLLEAAKGGGFGWFAVVGTWAVSLIGTNWMVGALVHAVGDAHDGRIDSSVGDSFRHVQPVLAPLILASVLAGLGVAVGLVLLIVPGLVLLTWWAVIAPVIVMERSGVGEAFRRSRALVRGHGWTVFGVLVITFVLTGIVQSILWGVFSAFLPDFFDVWIGGALANSIVAPFMAIAVVLVYLALTAKDEIAAQAASEPAP